MQLVNLRKCQNTGCSASFFDYSIVVYHITVSEDNWKKKNKEFWRQVDFSLLFTGRTFQHGYKSLSHWGEKGAKTHRHRKTFYMSKFNTQTVLTVATSFQVFIPFNSASWHTSLKQCMKLQQQTAQSFTDLLWWFPHDISAVWLPQQWKTNS